MGIFSKNPQISFPVNMSPKVPQNQRQDSTQTLDLVQTNDSQNKFIESNDK